MSKLEIKTNCETTVFRWLEIGELFEIVNTHAVCMKTILPWTKFSPTKVCEIIEHCEELDIQVPNAVNLATGRMFFVGAGEEIVRLKGRLEFELE